MIEILSRDFQKSAYVVGRSAILCNIWRFMDREVKEKPKWNIFFKYLIKFTYLAVE